MHSSQPAYAVLTRFSCVVLSYSLLLSLCAPFHIHGAASALARRRDSFAATPQGRPSKQRAARRDGELIVRFRQDVSEQEKEQIVASRGARRGRRLRGASRTDKLTLPAGHDPETLATELRLNPAVEFAEPNYLIKRNEIIPDDPRFGEQWALSTTSGAGAQAGSDIDATLAWDVTTGAASTVIAVIDSGVDFTHPDLRGNQWVNSREAENGQDDDGNDLVDDLHGWDWVAGSKEIKDEQGHGTIIAGLIAAQGNNAIGISGVMWRASLMSLRVLDETGTGDVANAVEAIDYAVEHGARVINCSWGMDEASEVLKDAISRAARRGVLVVCSAGNDGRNIDGAPYYPASFELDNLIAVASTNDSDQLTTWSNWGAMRVNMGAPGKNILSTKMGGGYKLVSGSSASAPQVSGVAGLLKTLRPHLSAKRTRELLLAGVRPVDTLTGKVSSGGVVNAAGALVALNSLLPDEGMNEGDETRDGNERDNPNGGNGNGGGHANGGNLPERPVERTQGAPGLNLPNLDDVRRLRPATPRVPAPIRSNLAPRCEPGDPACDPCSGCVPDPTPTPNPTPPPSSASPIGWLDSIGDGVASGWSFDPDASAQSIEAHFYIDGPSGSGQWAGSATANVPRLDVNQAYGIAGNHGFSFSIPPRFRNGQPHTLYVYGINATGNANALLSGVPKSFTLNATGSITASPNPIQVCDGTGLGITTLSWSTTGTTEVDVRVGAPNGTLFATTGGAGSATTGKWVTNGTIFYLQNANYEDRTSTANTLATVTVGITTSGCAAPTPTPTPAGDVVWVEDSVPGGGIVAGDAEGWNWVSSNPSPFSGATAHMSNIFAGLHQHYFYNATSGLTINSGERLVAYVYLDPANVPSEIMLQWNDGTWEHRAYWGTDSIAWGVNGTDSRRYMGALPAVGQWIRLEVPAAQVGLEGRTLNGMAFTLQGGRATWDRAGKATSGAPSPTPAPTPTPTPTPSPTPTAIGEVVWVEDAVPAGAATSGDSEGWNWTGSNPSPYSGTAAHQSNIIGGLHQHFFYNAASPLVVNAGDKLFTYIYLDPANVPNEVMLQWNDGTWEHRAYWGTDSIAWGLNGTDSRRYMGALPAAGQWVRLEVPASQVGLANRTVNGMAFTLHGGRATWDRAGAGSQAIAPVASDFSVTRLDPANRTGQSGTDLFSGNYNWGVPLVGLGGRAGLDLLLSLSYNSLIWTRDNTVIKYDADRGTPSAGFRLGFPVIESRFYNPVTGKNAYLMIAPTGQRIELRQVGSSGVYEAADSSYLQLVEGSTLTLRMTDGTQLSFVQVGNAYRCTQIKDRNGNLISVTYFGHGGIQTVTDTLGRVVSFHYDGNNRPLSIKQTWNSATHTWGTFGYSDIYVQPNFSGLAVHGPQGQTISVLTQVGFDDGTRYNFDYNTTGQVSMIHHYASDGHQLSYTAYDFNASGTDCPRVVGRRDYAEEWNNGAEAVTTYADEGNGVRAVTMPDRTTVYKEFFGTSGWQRGLSTRTETHSYGLQKWTTTEWTQDDPSLAYQLNPRPFDTSIYDAVGNRRRTTIAYTIYGLPSDIREYAAGGQNVMRRTHVDYKQDSVYLERRLIGLPAAQLRYEGENSLVAKSEFHYDWGGEYFSGQTPSVQHDGVSYGTGYLTGRGNLSAVRRFNKDAPDDPQQAVWQQLSGYNAAGSPVFGRDADWHTAQISYTDSYSDGNNSRNTLAYPTQMKDGDGFASTVQYNYDMGVVTRAQNPKGMSTSTAYDSAGRIERVTNETSNAYTRFVYGANNTYVQSFSLIEAGVESYSIRVFDGAGRVRATAANHPGSAGGYSGQFIKYDVMSRAIELTNRAEINAGWVPVGDDAAGWAWSKQAYDWKGRPTVTTGVDGTTKEMSYGGCGCAGGEVVTLKDEMGRRQRMTADVLGRAAKTEDLNADGSVYRTATNTYNALDQVTRVFVQEGMSGAGQETLLTYDGHGRLLTQKAPIQTNATVYAYNADDTVQSVTDARGAAHTMSCNARHLVTEVKYSAPTGITPTKPTTFGYDAAGNRTWMNDDAGRVDYTYNTLSQLTSETRQFAGLSGSYALTYAYTLAGQLQSVTDPAGVVVNYGYDAAGRLNNVTGSPYGGVSQYTTAMQYRAFGALKSLTYGNNQSLTQGFNARQQLAQMQVGAEISSVFEYYADGQIRYAKDNKDATKDRAYNYDQVGRLAEGLTGAEARGGVEADGIYHQTYQYDVWDNLTGRGVNRFWSGGQPFTDTYVNDRKTSSFYDAAGHVTKDSYGVGGRTHTYDAAGQKVKTSERSKSSGGVIGLTAGGTGGGSGAGEAQMSPGGYETMTTLTISQSYDGDGQSTKRVETKVQQTPNYVPVTRERVDYYVRSSVLGGRVVTELDSAGQKTKTHVYAGAEVVAEQDVYAGGAQGLTWQQANPITGTQVEQNTTNGVVQQKEYDPFGLELGDADPYLNDAEPDYARIVGGSFYREGGNPFDGGGGCTIDHMAASCDEARRRLDLGIAEQCRDNNCNPRVIRDTRNGKEYLAPLGRDPDTGRLGYWFRFTTQTSVTVEGKTQMYPGRPQVLWIDAAASPQYSVEVPLPDIGAGIKNLLNDPTCASFVKSLINTTATATNNPAHSDNALTLYGMLSGIVFAKQVINGRAVGGTVGGSISEKNATIKISPGRVSSLAGATVHEHTQLGYIMVGLHETIHHAGTNGYYSDPQLARAAFKLMSPERQAASPLPDRKDFANDWAFTLASSGYWNAELNRNCNPTRR